MVRLDALSTILCDAGLLFGAMLVRHALRLGFEWLGPESAASFVGFAVTLITDVALVGTALVITVFDLVKLARAAYLRVTQD